MTTNLGNNELFNPEFVVVLPPGTFSMCPDATLVLDSRKAACIISVGPIYLEFLE
jgi:hypothetical protein